MRSGRLTARAIAERYLTRIEALNLQGPHLRALIDSIPTPWRLPTSSTPSARPARCAARCTAFQSR